MHKVGILSKDKRIGSIAQQKERIGDVDLWIYPDEHYKFFFGAFRENEGDIAIIAHAGTFGRYRGGFHKRNQILQSLTDYGVDVQIGKDGEPVTYDEASKIAEFHASAMLPTGIGTPKQKKNPGRPKTYSKPEGEKLKLALEWYAGPLHLRDVGSLIGQMMGTKPVSRPTMVAWFGRRPKCKGRVRDTRSDKKS
jgi:hypothetical protein